jgi:predicted nucleic acid-binding protein
VIQAVDLETYSASEEDARKRLLGRDPDDWPVLATALVLNCPIWTEDADFFGAGVATWTTDRVEMFLQGVGRG